MHKQALWINKEFLLLVAPGSQHYLRDDLQSETPTAIHLCSSTSSILLFQANVPESLLVTQLSTER